MAGKIVADTLEHSTAGSVTTDYVVNGSAKAWVNFNGTGTIATRDSLNVASLTDNGTGNYTVTFSSAIANSNYSISSSSGQPERPLRTGSDKSGGDVTTASVRLHQYYGTSGAALGEDVGFITFSLHGDLA